MTEQDVVSRAIGTPLKRREDPRLITGSADYTDDIQLPGMVHAAIVRSPHAHARIRSIDTQAAEQAPGVLVVFTGADTEETLQGVPCAWNVPDSDVKQVTHPVIATDKVRYVGDAVAVVVAEDRYQAQDAADLVDVDYEVLSAVVDPKRATEDGAPQLHDDAPNNVAFHWVAAGGDVDSAFEGADVVVRERILQQRLIPNAMEPRSAVAQWNGAMNDLTLWTTSQNPHIVRFLMSVVTGLPEQKIRVISPEVGGGFGSKIPFYPDEIITAFCSMQVGRPVKWTETRSENFRVTIHGRDHIHQAELAATQDGRILALRSTVWAGMGAYLSTASTGIPTILHGLMYSGVYDIPNLKADVYGVFTNTTPVDAYRGAGRPEATFLVERLVNLLADELGEDPVETRRRNFIAGGEKFENHPVAMGITYDSGHYGPALDRALEMVGYDELRREQARLRNEGRYLGIGLCTYAEICGLGPSEVAGAVGFGGGLYGSAVVRFHPTGKVNVMIGTSPHGQGEETTFAQIVADELGLDVDDVEVLKGDTDNTPMGWGTYGSRTTSVDGPAIVGSTRKIKEKAKVIAAHLLEAAVEDIEFEDGEFFVRGSPDQSKTIQDIALMASVAWDMPEGVEPGLEAATYFDPSNFVYPFGAHVSVVEVDADTGEVQVKRYVAVDDCGNRINPMIVDGQIHGGIAQGIGPALWEGAVYDDNGQLLTGTLMDYAIPKASFLPSFELDETVTPSPVNALGVKGVGETGTIASTIAVYNAVMDALEPFGVAGIDMPLTSEKVWQAIHGNGRS